MQPSDPRLAEYLKEYPPQVFSERLYQSIELMERHSVEMAIDLARRLNLVDHLSQWRSVDDLCSRLSFQPLSSSRYIGSWNVWSKSNASRHGSTGTLVVTICGARCGNPISKACVRQLCKLIPRTRRLWIYWITLRAFIQLWPMANKVVIAICL